MSETTEPNKARLRALVRTLKKIPRQRFDMGCWGAEGKCGTVACIAGWYAELNPVISGLRLDTKRNRIVGLVGPGVNSERLARHFGIERQEAFEMFIVQAGFKEVSSRILEIVKRYGVKVSRSSPSADLKR